LRESPTLAGDLLREAEFGEFGEFQPYRPVFDVVPAELHQFDELDTADGPVPVDEPEEVVRASVQRSSHTDRW